MCTIEMKEFDRANMMTENLMQFVKYHKNEKPKISLRDNCIIKLLHDLAQNGFIFETLKEKTLSTCSKLSGNDKKYNWQPLTPELIPFHEWMGSKLKMKKIITKNKMSALDLSKKENV